ncbi:MAG: TrpR like protein, YerC/YecD [uncultured bacterium]|nr:MAG: TrpR like protein, YerC/YecD [uncultured bacterium]HBD04972.1 hypothetical protein [Candidatus Uhrbacteria bacterium]
MAKYNPNKVPYQIQEDILNSFCEVLFGLKSNADVKDFIKDLLNRQERIMLARRLMIANMLFSGATYDEIQNELRASPNTISRVERWLHFGRRGYVKAILEAIKLKEKKFAGR